MCAYARVMVIVEEKNEKERKMKRREHLGTN